MATKSVIREPITVVIPFIGDPKSVFALWWVSRQRHMYPIVMYVDGADSRATGSDALTRVREWVHNFRNIDGSLMRDTNGGWKFSTIHFPQLLECSRMLSRITEGTTTTSTFRLAWIMSQAVSLGRQQSPHGRPVQVVMVDALRDLHDVCAIGVDPNRPDAAPLFRSMLAQLNFNIMSPDELRGAVCEPTESYSLDKVVRYVLCAADEDSKEDPETEPVCRSFDAWNAMRVCKMPFRLLQDPAAPMPLKGVCSRQCLDCREFLDKYYEEMGIQSQFDSDFANVFVTCTGLAW